MSGPQPITYSELDRWSAMTGTELLREEIDVLMDIDDAFIRALADERPKSDAKPGKYA